MKIKQVFISSVSKEFEALRKKIRVEKFLPFDDSLIIIMLGDKGGGADSRGPLDASLENTSDADIFILLLGESYGTVPSGEDKSYTHLEYDEAIKQGKNILVFPIGDIYTNPDGIQYSKNINFRKWQKDILNNSNTHTTATAFSSNDSIDKIYNYINKELHHHILQNYNKDKKLDQQPNQLKFEEEKNRLNSYNKEHCIIFIHDFFSDKKPFLNKKENYFHEYLLNTYKEIFDFDYSFNYNKEYTLLNLDKYLQYTRHIPIIRNFINLNYPSVEQVSRLLLERYKQKLQQGYKTVSFIGHGLGGIIAKKAIIDLCKNDSSFEGLYISLATPHNNLNKITKNNSRTLAINQNTTIINSLITDWQHYKQQIIRRYYCDADDTILIPEVVFPDDLEIHKCLIQTEKNESISEPCRYDSDIVNDLNIFLKKGIHQIIL